MSNPLRTALVAIQELHSEGDSVWDERKICSGCSSRLSEKLFPCLTRKLADEALNNQPQTNGENNE